MNISICRPDEYDDLADIFIEMETYYNQTLCLSRRDMSVYLRDKIFAADSGTEVHKVVCDGVIAAFSCVSVMYPSPRFSGQMFIKELFVSAPFRRAGIGRELMSFIASRAKERGCFQLDWLSVTADPLAQTFYESLGAQIIRSVNYHRISGPSIDKLARRAN
ncbi:GNAT family N-acetyltransferase [Enterobacter ludwigii]|uniref:GNAT family N-acetyltransferase n=1 Tax=Enterobacter ludwigii TaxID=299767 RepID=UPI000DE28FB0|nr:GNAT family N-acetyltransferase [Enterobacter ludwigii]MBT1848655.1 GNAT family N-acetyltransferase [Enterobacter ludwigii]MBX9029255.1 GNAT family N-acetyltransferase [Enterobacter ludwigii]RBO22799.1 GNAT family N-acetyltransferase [Enterobacter ludwigii]WGC21426.1 GNAT family N-acetyltransferase [Enterobacter ludwigii]WRM14223.1 GNAT family N-acetyltransferase [Enterobacter ludwigii]